MLSLQGAGGAGEGDAEIGGGDSPIYDADGRPVAGLPDIHAIMRNVLQTAVYNAAPAEAAETSGVPRVTILNIAALWHTVIVTPHSTSDCGS